MRETYKVVQPSSGFPFPEKGIWIPCAPIKTAFYTWKATWSKVLTLDKLQRRGWQLPNRCYLCGCTEETIHHILLHCIIVSSLWEIILNLVAIHWDFPKMVKEAITSWKERRERRLGIIFLCALFGSFGRRRIV